MPGRGKWRGVYAEENAFAICPDMRSPLWLHMIPDFHKYGRRVGMVPRSSLKDFPRVRTPCGHGAQVIIEGR